MMPTWIATLDRLLSRVLGATLQSSFLLPPFGYALMMVRGAAKHPAPFRPFVRALLPFLLAQWALLAPRLVHLIETAGESVRAPAVPISNEDISKKINSMIPPPPLPGEAK